MVCVRLGDSSSIWINSCVVSSQPAVGEFPKAATLGRMEFEWDPIKAARNLRKHKVSFDEAVTVFGDFLSTTAPDPDHSADEKRYITIGISNRRRSLMVAHRQRGRRIRIISARKLSQNERRAYEEIQS